MHSKEEEASEELLDLESFEFLRLDSRCIRRSQGLFNVPIAVESFLSTVAAEQSDKPPVPFHQPKQPDDRSNLDLLNRLSYMLEEVIEHGKPIEQVALEMRHSTYVQSLALARRGCMLTKK